MENTETKKILGSVIAIIPARGGSKRLPGKNLLPLNGMPLIAHSIIAAQLCRYIDRCIVSTEDPEIKETALSYGAEVIDRPAQLAEDHITTRQVINYLLVNLLPALPDYFVLLQPTSPLRSGAQVTRCLELFTVNIARSAVSVTGLNCHPYKTVIAKDGSLHGTAGQQYLDQPDQNLPPAYALNGAIYLTPCRLFLKQGSFFIHPVMPYIMDQRSSIDINTLEDLKNAATYSSIQ